MARKITIFDTTLRDGEQSPGCSMNLSEKLEVARALTKLGVDVIEAGFAITSKGDTEAIQAISREVKGVTVCSLARCVEKDIDAAYEALKNAEQARIHCFLATSPIHMTYKLKMTEEQVLERTEKMIKYAKTKMSDIQFSAEDACRSELPFLVKVFETAIDAGATTINVPDTVGYITPTEMFSIIKHLKENVRNIDKAVIAVHCHNDLGMAVANTIGGVAAGAGQVECTINGIGERAGNAALEEVVMALATRKGFYDCETNIDTKRIYRTSKLLQSITGWSIPANKAIVGSNAFAHESGIHQHGVLSEKSTYEIMSPQDIGMPENSMVLGKHSGKHAFTERLVNLGYNLTEQEIEKYFENFKALADKKKQISDRDIEALVGGGSVEAVGQYSLKNFVINSGNTISATATVTLVHEGETLESVEIGDGPVDASFKAINRIIGRNFELHDYSLRSVTEGEDALGEATVKLKDEQGSIVTGRGVSTDIIESSIKAYISGINKILAR